MDRLSEQELAELRTAVSRYSILVGFLLILVFVAPCVLFALLAKYCQKQTTRRKPTVSYGDEYSSYHPSTPNLMGSTRDSGILETLTLMQGMYGQVNCPASSFECIEKIAISSNSCISTWKSCVPPAIVAGNAKQFIIVKRAKEIAQQKNSPHANCLKGELSVFNSLLPHPHILNLLGTGVTSGTLHTVMLEYPPYGSLHHFLLCKRRARIAESADLQPGLLALTEEEEDVTVEADAEAKDSCVEELIAQVEVRCHAYQEPLRESLTEMDHLVMAIQICSGMDYLCSKQIFNHRLSSEVVMIGKGFYLKLTGMEGAHDVAMVITNSPASVRHHSQPSLMRAPSGRNLFKWNPPEVLEKGEFTEKSAVWRFGMTLWELISVGDAPFQDIPHRLLLDVLKREDRPLQPEGCSQDLYKMMSTCWEGSPEKRPQFRELLDDLKRQLMSYVPGVTFIAGAVPRRISFNDENIRKGIAGTIGMISATAGVNRVPRPILRSHTSVSSPLSESGLVHRTPTTSPSSCGSLSEFVDTPLLLRQPNDPVFPLAARQQAYNETDV